jgi:glycolate oxidase
VRALELLEDEVRICLGLLGVDRLDKLDGSYLHFGAPPVVPAHVTSAFPLLAEGY